MSNKDIEGFYQLTPHTVLDSIDKAGFETTGRYLQLNSYENRVFSTEINTNIQTDHVETIISKFYRPNRWSKEAILEEHQFLFDLTEQGIPAIAPLIQSNDSSLSTQSGIHFALFPKALGRQPQEFYKDDYRSIGRILARLHSVGEQKVSQHRPVFDVDTYGISSMHSLWPRIPEELKPRYKHCTDLLFDFLDERLDRSKFIRIHGDCHKGNILQTDPIVGNKSYFFVDFDDFCMGPVVQDFWMLLTGDEYEDQGYLEALCEGYGELRVINKDDLLLIPALRALRIIYYAGWISRRWADPSFPYIFPQFTTDSYWGKEIESLEKIIWTL